MPVWRTILNIALHRESGIPPSKILLQHKKLLAAARIRRLDEWHPLVFRSSETLKETISRLGLRNGKKDRPFTLPERYLTHLQMSVKILPDSEGPARPQEPLSEIRGELIRLDKRKKANRVKLWIANLPSETVFAYSDGSSCGRARSAWRYSLYRGGQMIGNGSGPMLGAEILRAQRALEAAIEKPRGAPIKILLDSHSAIHALKVGRSKSSQWIVDKFVAQLRDYQQVEIQWIPSHCGIIGNEKADGLAKNALKHIPAQLPAGPGELKYTFESIKR